MVVEERVIVMEYISVESVWHKAELMWTDSDRFPFEPSDPQVSTMD